VQNALIFCNRKRDVDILLKSLLKHGFSAGALHGDLAQSVRFATLEKFKAGELRLLVCSDVAARGIDIGGLSHVFNFDVPHHAEDYVHRIGRTGRAGREGRAYTIATPEDRLSVETVEKLIAAPIPRVEIPGLDVVEWAEGDGRRGRFRGRGKPVKPSRGDKPQEETRDRAAKPAREPRRDEPRREEPRREEHRDREDPRRRERERDRDRGDRNERNDRGDGPSVRGFGNDVPAFMLIRRRGPLKAILDEPVEDDDVDPDNGAGMAA
jgi:superfamily II DNA/RNA helicase